MKEQEIEEPTRRIMPEVKRRIHELIIEERGINSKVRIAVMEALMAVKENIDKFANGETVNAKIKLDDRIINIYFDRKDNVGQSGYALYFNNTLDPFMQCYIPFSDGKINMPEVADTIQHEINHILQQHKSQKQYGRNVNYAMAATNMYDIDDAKRVVARVIYLSRDYEQDSIVNGLYAYIMQCLSDGICIEKEKTDAYVQLSNLYYADEFVSKPENRNSLKVAMAEYPEMELTIHKLKYLIRYAKNQMSRKIGRILSKCQKDSVKICGVTTQGDNDWLFW